MLTWIRRFGMLIVFLVSAMIIVPFTQWRLCQSSLIELDHQGVGFTNCSYFRSGIEVLLLLIGNILVVAGYVIERLRK